MIDKTYICKADIKPVIAPTIATISIGTPVLLNTKEIVVANGIKPVAKEEIKRRTSNVSLAIIDIRLYPVAITTAIIEMNIYR